MNSISVVAPWLNSARAKSAMNITAPLSTQTSRMPPSAPAWSAETCFARSAGQIAADNAALDGLARSALLSAYGNDGLRISDLSGMVGAIRTRVLHAWAKELGASGAALSHRHVAALDALITDWHGQGPVHLPGGIRVARVRGGLVRVP